MQSASRIERMVPLFAVGVTLVPVAFWLAQASMLLLAHELWPPDLTSAVARHHADALASSATPRELGELILQRNVLDSRTGAMGWTVPPPARPPQHPERAAPFVESDEVPLCDAPLRVAALFVAPEPARSRLTLEGAGTTQLAGLGTRIDDGHEVLAISERSAWLRPSGRPVCRVSMFEPRSASSAARPEIGGTARREQRADGPR